MFSSKNWRDLNVTIFQGKILIALKDSVLKKAMNSLSKSIILKLDFNIAFLSTLMERANQLQTRVHSIYKPVPQNIQ